MLCHMELSYCYKWALCLSTRCQCVNSPSALVTAVLSEPYVVWESGTSGNFTIELELRYPPQTITYPLISTIHSYTGSDEPKG